MKKPFQFPKKAKLITDGGFYRIIDIDIFSNVINYPLIKRMNLSTPETGSVDLTLSFHVEFRLEKVLKRMAIYRQFNVTQTLK